MKQRPLIIDTDVAMGMTGEDIDDGFAIAVANSDITRKIVFLTTVDGNIDAYTASKCANVILKKLSLDVPVYIGATRPLSGERRKYWGILNETPESSKTSLPAAVKLIEAAHNADASGITILALGPLTNLALAFLLDPSITRSIVKVVIMGGYFWGTQWNGGIAGEFNFWADPEAANIVLRSNIDLSLIGLDVTRKVTMNQSEVLDIQQSGSIFGKYAAGCGLDWLKHLQSNNFILHDPLAAVALIKPEIFDWQKMSVDVAVDGAFRGLCVTGKDKHHECLVAKDVDVKVAKQYIIESLSSAETH